MNKVNKMKDYSTLNEINGAWYVARATAHMNVTDRETLGNRTYLITVPIKSGSDMASVTTAIVSKIRKVFGFAFERKMQLGKQECCIGVVACPDYGGSRFVESYSPEFMPNMPHVHAVLFVPKVLANQYTAPGQNLEKDLKAALLTLKEVKQGVNQIHVVRYQPGNRSIFGMTDYSVKAEKKLNDVGMSVQAVVFPLEFALRKRLVGADAYYNEVKSVQAQLYKGGPNAVKVSPGLLQ